jgi:hypothetical protein
MLPAILALALTTAPLPPALLRVAIYDGPGVSASRSDVVRAVASDKDLAIFRISPDEIRRGELAQYDVLIHPGGVAAAQGKALGEPGREAERSFLRQGGGYVGICAGAYLATVDYSWSLHVLDAVVVDKEHWNRGTGNVKLAFTNSGQPFAKAQPFYYHQGPLLSAALRPELADYDEFAAFAGDIYLNGAIKGVMPGTTALCGGAYGKGRVFACSPHPEKTTETWGTLPAAVRWAGHKHLRAEVGLAESPRKR